MRDVWPLLISHSCTVSPCDAAMRAGDCPCLLAFCSACAMRIGAISLEAAIRSRQPSAVQSSRPDTKFMGGGIGDKRSRLRTPPPSTKSTSRFGCTRTRASLPIWRRKANVSS
jgi:hypothetical protein